jgi:formylglycine-generating enzyme required for sulfatase activity
MKKNNEFSIFLLVILTFTFKLNLLGQNVPNAYPNYTPTQFVGIKLSVSNMNSWLTFFGEVAGKYNQYGVLPIGFSQNAADPNLLTIGYAFTEKSKAREYFSSALFAGQLKKADITSKPEITYYHILDAIDEGYGSLNYVILAHEVSDYHNWKEAFFASTSERLEAGLFYSAILRNLDKPNEIKVIFSYSDKNVAFDFFENKYLSNKMSSSGIIGKPTTEYVRLFSGENESEEKTSFQDPTNPVGMFKLALAANVPCNIVVNGEQKGLLIPGSLGQIVLPVGFSKLKFSSTVNSSIEFNKEIEVKKMDQKDMLFVDLQEIIHQQVRKEKSPLDTVTQKFYYPMIKVKGGEYKMGNNSLSDEMHEHMVRLDDFSMGKFEVTQKLWKDVTGQSPSHFKNCDQCPVENVSHDDVLIFIQKLNNLTGKKFRLPTEAEWEYAAKGGKKSENFQFSGSNNLDEVAWYGGNSYKETHPVGQKKPNELGLYDMTGNVLEWCYDWFSYTFSGDGTLQNPNGPKSGELKILRGGSWSHIDSECLPSFRNKDEPINRNHRTGFRLAL